MTHDTSSSLQVFTAPTGVRIRTVVNNGEPFWVVSDLATALGYRDAHNAARSVDDDEKGYSIVSTPGGDQQMLVVNESGLYTLIVRSNQGDARTFRRWITGEVLPSIRRAGTYSVPQQRQSELEVPADYASALRLAADQFERAEQATARAVELEPSAAAWDKLATATGDYAVADAAKILSRDPDIRIGRDRLFTLMRTWHWIYRPDGGAHRVYQTAVDTGRLTELPSSHYHPRTGELVLDPPQVRVTVKGLADIRARLTASTVAKAA